ncbi:hypothetical protein J4405_06260 [Candidatus Woesearchaeota archaeon]|nr:hypothetical protein [Candidatus Woesearchaeota archaeon]
MRTTQTSLGSIARKTLAGIVLGAQALSMGASILSLSSCSQNSQRESEEVSYNTTVMDTVTSYYDERVDTVTNYTRDLAGRVIKEEWDVNGDEVIDYIYQYTRDSAGRIKKIDLDVNSDGIIDETIKYTRDSAGNITISEWNKHNKGVINKWIPTFDSTGAIIKTEGDVCVCQ